MLEEFADNVLVAGHEYWQQFQQPVVFPPHRQHVTQIICRHELDDGQHAPALHRPGRVGAGRSLR